MNIPIRCIADILGIGNCWKPIFWLDATWLVKQALRQQLQSWTRNLPKALWRRPSYRYCFPVEQYLVKVIQPEDTSDTFDDVRYRKYTSKYKTLSQLPPTSSAIEGQCVPWSSWYQIRNSATCDLCSNVFALCQWSLRLHVVARK